MPVLAPAPVAPVRPPAPTRPAAPGYFERTLPPALILAAFGPGGWLTVADFGPPPADAVFPLEALQGVAAAALLTAVGLLAAAAAGLVRTWHAADRPGGLGFALAYLGVQAAGALIGAVSLPLYLAALAVHYVEYHVLMAPRCFRAPLDPAWRVDRAFAVLRANRVVFYAAVVAVAGLVTVCGAAGMAAMGRLDAGVPPGYLALVAVFDGLFVFHYLVEMFIWRFSDPHFRRQLGGLYFAAAAPK